MNDCGSHSSVAGVTRQVFIVVVGFILRNNVVQKTEVNLNLIYVHRGEFTKDGISDLGQSQAGINSFRLCAGPFTTTPSFLSVDLSFRFSPCKVFTTPID
jgi:hypothetical protein